MSTMQQEAGNQGETGNPARGGEQGAGCFRCHTDEEILRQDIYPFDITLHLYCSWTI